MDSVGAAASTGCPHALVLHPKMETSDVEMLRVIQQAHDVSGGTIIVVHPPSGPVSEEFSHLDRRWAVLLEKASAVHNDVRVVLRIPPPAGMR